MFNLWWQKHLALLFFRKSSTTPARVYSNHSCLYNRGQIWYNDWQRSVTGPDWEKERYKFCCSDWLYFYYCVQSEGSTRLTKLRLVLNKYESSLCYCTAFFLPYKFSQQFILLFSSDRSRWLGQHFFLLHNEPRSLVLAHVRGTGCPEAFWSMPVHWKLRVMRLIHMCKLVRQCQAERLQPDRSQHQRSREILHKLNPLLLLNHYEPHRQILNQLTSDMADRQWTTLTVIITLINLSGCWSVLHHRATSQPSHFKNMREEKDSQMEDVGGWRV